MLWKAKLISRLSLISQATTCAYNALLTLWRDISAGSSRADMPIRNTALQELLEIPSEVFLDISYTAYRDVQDMQALVGYVGLHEIN